MKDKGENAKLRVDAIQEAFKQHQMDLSLDEVECILAGLVYKGWVKGMISHSNRMLITSKTDPFPKARGVVEIGNI